MYILQPQAKFIDFAHQTILSLIQSVNSPMVAAGDFPAEETQGFIVSLQARDQSIRVFIYLHLQGSNQCVIYRFDPTPIMGDRLQSAESEALDFVESMGFMMDNLNFNRLNANDQGKALKELPVFYPELSAYLPILEQKREAQGQGSLENISDGEGMAKGRSTESPSGQYFPRSDMLEVQDLQEAAVPAEEMSPHFLNESEAVHSIQANQSIQAIQAPSLLAEQTPAQDLPLEEALVAPLGGQESLQPIALEEQEVQAGTHADEELSKFFQPENISEMVAEIDRTKVPVTKPSPAMEIPVATPKVSAPPKNLASPARGVAASAPPVPSRRAICVLSPEEKRQFLKLILSI